MAHSAVLSAAARSKVVAGVSVIVKAVDCRDLAEAAVVPAFNAKLGAKSRHAVVGFFRKGNEALRRRRVRSRERRAQGGLFASPVRVCGGGRKWLSFYFSCAFQSSPAGRSVLCSSPLRERSTSASRSGW